MSGVGRRHAVASGLVLLLAVSRAHAQEELDESPHKTLADDGGDSKMTAAARDARARHLFEAGRTAWDEGRFREAWEHWHESYRLSRRPELLYNVGQAADRLRMDREALEAFRMYLAKNPDATNRREVETRIRVLEREVERDALQVEQGQGAAGPETLPDDPERDTAGSTRLASDGDEESEPDESGEQSGDSTSPTGEPQRDDWYVRASAGLGLMGGNFSDTAGNESTLSAMTFVLDGALGYGVREGLVIGGRLFLDFALNPSIEPNGGASQDLKSVRLLLLSAFVDYYLSPKTSGFHVLGGIGFGSLAISDTSASLGNASAGGGGIYAGAGYEWPFGREWAVGVEGRMLVGRFSQDLGDHTLLLPAITASAVWY